LGTFEATAYDLSFESCGKHPDHPAYGITASGTKARLGVVAVDPKVIPLGTKLYVEGYGNAIAEDVGGAIKGRLLDVFFNTKNECIQWGRKQVNVWIVD
ncbi:MAG TPA: 3D domain-containing protein, partial [Tissierellaceae bacterium]|nr:3D domain-containing protein [Tissierellaceae bacterium]